MLEQNRACLGRCLGLPRREHGHAPIQRSSPGSDTGYGRAIQPQISQDIWLFLNNGSEQHQTQWRDRPWLQTETCLGESGRGDSWSHGWLPCRSGGLYAYMQNAIRNHVWPWRGSHGSSLCLSTKDWLCSCAKLVCEVRLTGTHPTVLVKRLETSAALQGRESKGCSKGPVKGLHQCICSSLHQPPLFHLKALE
jgi:hypothetical protein